MSGQFGTGAEVSYGHFSTSAEMSWVRSVLGPKCLDTVQSSAKRVQWSADVYSLPAVCAC